MTAKNRLNKALRGAGEFSLVYGVFAICYAALFGPADWAFVGVGAIGVSFIFYMTYLIRVY